MSNKIKLKDGKIAERFHAIFYEDQEKQQHQVTRWERAKDKAISRFSKIKAQYVNKPGQVLICSKVFISKREE